MTPQSPSNWAPGDLTQFSQLLSAAPFYFPESHRGSEIFLSKMILVLGKNRSHRASNLGCRGAESPGRFDVSPKDSARDVMQEQMCCRDEAANHQLVACGCGLLSRPNSFHRGMFKLNAKLDADPLLCSLSHFE